MWVQGLTVRVLVLWNICLEDKLKMICSIMVVNQMSVKVYSCCVLYCHMQCLVEAHK